jgi:hypothetical protein
MKIILLATAAAVALATPAVAQGNWINQGNYWNPARPNFVYRPPPATNPYGFGTGYRTTIITPRYTYQGLPARNIYGWR